MNNKKFEVGDRVVVRDGVSSYFSGCRGTVVGREDKVQLSVFVRMDKDNRGNKNIGEADFRDKELELFVGEEMAFGVEEEIRDTLRMFKAGRVGMETTIEDLYGIILAYTGKDGQEAEKVVK